MRISFFVASGLAFFGILSSIPHVTEAAPYTCRSSTCHPGPVIVVPRPNPIEPTCRSSTCHPGPVIVVPRPDPIVPACLRPCTKWGCPPCPITW